MPTHCERCGSKESVAEITHSMIEACDEPITRLARVLFDRMERLAPAVDDSGEWADLADWERDLYCE